MSHLTIHGLSIRYVNKKIGLDNKTIKFNSGDQGLASVTGMLT